MGKTKKGPRFNQKLDETIVRHSQNKSYSEICKEINETIECQDNHFNSKQIRQRFTNNLNPNLCHDDLDNNEKEFITQWAGEHTEVVDGTITIHWNGIIPEMKRKFKKLRSDNKIKNFWHLKKRTDLAAKSFLKLPPFPIPIKNITTSFTFPPIQLPTTPSLEPLEPEPFPPQFKEMKPTL